MKHSNALHSIVRGGGSYFVGPLARFNLNAERLPATAQEAARECGLSVPCRNPFRSMLARVVETVFACDEALRIIDGYRPPPTPRAKLPVRGGTGSAITEAPRGILYHRYRLGVGGLIEHARIVPPTSQNQKRIEDDLLSFAAQISDRPVEEITLLCEQAIRNSDPCISCATHFLKSQIDRE